MSSRLFNKDQDDFMIANAADMTAREFAGMFDVNIRDVFNAGIRLNLTFKSARMPKVVTHHDRAKRRRGYVPDRRSTIVRPPAVYSNCSPLGIASANRIL